MDSRVGEQARRSNPAVAGVRLYLKLIVRGNCVVISFHEEGDDNGD